MNKQALQLIALESKLLSGYLDLSFCSLTAENPYLDEIWSKLGKLIHL
jgi:hypothetical protein